MAVYLYIGLFGALVVVYAVVVVGVVLTVAAAPVAWSAAGPHGDLLPGMFLPRGLTLELLIWEILI